MRHLLFVIVLQLSFCSSVVHAQTCSGSLGAPVLNFTFGAGTDYGIGPALPGDEVRGMTYYADACAGPSDYTGNSEGQYTIATELPSYCEGGTWQIIGHDHTNDPYGYMMIINASAVPSVFFTKRIKGNELCPNSVYFFGSWVMNILKNESQTSGYIAPNLTFNIKSIDGHVLKSISTGDIKAETSPTWLEFGALFTSPADGSDIIIEIANNAPGGNGNDLALDDITVSPCGPLIQTGFGILSNQTAKKNCAHDNVNYTLVSTQVGYTLPDYQWQVNKNDNNGWKNVVGAKQPSLNVVIPNAAAATYQYRVGLLNKAEIGAESCRIYSDPLTINVFAPSSFTLPPVTNACEGHELILGATDGDTFEWTGPNNFHKFDIDPIVTNTVTAAIAGVYTLNIIKNNCPLFQSTTVKVYDAPTISPLKDVTICEGEFIPLSIQSNNVTHFKWTPSTGLDRDDIPNPIANPFATTRYTITVSNDACSGLAPTASLTIKVLKKPVANAGNTIRIFEGQSVTLEGSAEGDSIKTFWTPTTYLDDPSRLTPTATPSTDLTYTLHAESEAGCGENSSNVFVRVYKNITIPNTITPNNDGTNDLWNIRGLDNYQNATVIIFNRYGQQVFYTQHYIKAWGGTYNNAPLPAGTYYYIIDLHESNLPKLSGWLLVIR